MPVIHEDLERLYAALQNPTAEIMYQGRKQTFRSVEEVERQIVLVTKMLNSGVKKKPKVRGYRVNVNKGL